jgi:hypothetical protein
MKKVFEQLLDNIPDYQEFFTRVRDALKRSG